MTSPVPQKLRNFALATVLTILGAGGIAGCTPDATDLCVCKRLCAQAELLVATMGDISLHCLCGDGESKRLLRWYAAPECTETE